MPLKTQAIGGNSKYSTCVWISNFNVNEPDYLDCHVSSCGR